MKHFHIEMSSSIDEIENSLTISGNFLRHLSLLTDGAPHIVNSCYLFVVAPQEFFLGFFIKLSITSENVVLLIFRALHLTCKSQTSTYQETPKEAIQLVLSIQMRYLRR